MSWNERYSFDKTAAPDPSIFHSIMHGIDSAGHWLNNAMEHPIQNRWDSSKALQHWQNLKQVADQYHKVNPGSWEDYTLQQQAGDYRGNHYKPEISKAIGGLAGWSATALGIHNLVKKIRGSELGRGAIGEAKAIIDKASNPSSDYHQLRSQHIKTETDKLRNRNNND